MSIIDSYIVSEEEADQRLYDLAYHAFKGVIPSRKGIKKAIKLKCLSVDGVAGESGWKLRAGQRIDLLADYSKIPKIYEFDVPVLFEGQHIAVLNKPAGLIVSGNQYRTLFNTLGHNLTKSTLTDALPYPTPCHRLDKATSGCILIAKTKTAQIEIGRQFTSKELQKEYITIVHGELSDEGFIDSNINGQEAYTRYEKVKHINSKHKRAYSLIKAFPQTGRTHQLRIHFASLGHPILGDKLYGEKGNILLHKGLFLCARSISIMLNDKLVEVNCDIPRKFERMMNMMAKGV